jgi:hypothetical protein
MKSAFCLTAKCHDEFLPLLQLLYLQYFEDDALTY